MKKYNFRKISILVGLMGSLSIFNVNAMSNKNYKNENKPIYEKKQWQDTKDRFFNLRENVELNFENDKIIKWVDETYITPEEFVKRFLYDRSLYRGTQNYERNLINLLSSLMDKFLETNIKNYKETISECAQLRNDIINLHNKKENYCVDGIFYEYDDDIYGKIRINSENIRELLKISSKLYNPELYEKLVMENEGKKIKNLEIKKNNTKIEENIKDLRKILNDEDHGCCEFLEYLKYEILNRICLCENKDDNKEFVKGKISLIDSYSRNMNFLNEIINIAEGNNKEYTFKNLSQKIIEGYKMFLILRKCLEILNNEFIITCEGNYRLDNRNIIDTTELNTELIKDEIERYKYKEENKNESSLGTMLQLNLNRINDNKIFFDMRENVELLYENDKIIKWVYGPYVTYVTPLEFIKHFLDDKKYNELLCKKTQNCHFLDNNKYNKLLYINTRSYRREILNVLAELIDKFLETNINNYKETISECEQFKNEIANFRNKMKCYNFTGIYYDYDDKTGKYRINDENASELMDKNSKLYNPELYKKLVKESEERKIKNKEIRKYNDKIEDHAENLKYILNSGHHDFCIFLKDLRDGILKETGFFDDKGYPEFSSFSSLADKRSMREEILFKKNYCYCMKYIEKALKFAEDKNNDHIFENLDQKTIASYMIFLILRKFMEIFNNNPSDYIKESERNNYHLKENNSNKKNESKSSYRKKQFVKNKNMNHYAEKNNEKLGRNNYHLERNNYHKENESKSSYRKKQFVKNKNMNHYAEKNEKELKRNNYHLERNNYHKENKNNSPYMKKHIINKNVNNYAEKNDKELKRNNYHLKENNPNKENERKSSYRKKQYIEKYKNINRKITENLSLNKRDWKKLNS